MNVLYMVANLTSFDNIKSHLLKTMRTFRLFGDNGYIIALFKAVKYNALFCTVHK